jgi:pimeloyl-ACP methyl ester carboxylesterase/DNA-binding CsgD family transcriptional regulator
MSGPKSMAHPAQQIRFCTSRDGTRIAYAVCGSGPPLLRAPHWLTHLDLDWESPVWRPWLSLLGRSHTLIRYDHRGCGLSDRDGVAFSLERFVEDFEAVVAAAKFDRFAVFGWAGGASTAIAYAARHPERVERMVVYGCNVVGRIARANTPELRQEAETQLSAIELGWPIENPAFRQLFTSLAIPDGTPEQFRSFNDQIRRTVPPANAAKIMRTYWTLDFGSIAPQVRCPTLVFHAREDARIPFEQGRALAALMPNATFVPLESRNHLVIESEPAWRQFAGALEDLLRPSSLGDPLPSIDELTARERQVLELVAQGLDNTVIAVRLKISAKTIRNHVSNIFSKLGAGSRAQAVALARDAGLGRGRAP